MTTPNTADVRTWARNNGITVADRGRLPANVHQAYLAARAGKAAPALTKKAKAPVRKAPARKAPVRKAPARATMAPRAVPQRAPQPASAAPPRQPLRSEPAEKPDKVAVLEERLAVLTTRVAKLETAPRPSLFRRRNG